MDEFVRSRSHIRHFDRILSDAGLTQVDMLKKMFDQVTSDYIRHSEQEIELLQALGADELMVTEQIKAGTMEAARGMFEYCYRYLTGERSWSVWDE